MSSTKNEQLQQESLWQLHLRKAKGELLTDEEQQQLAAWYAKQEQQERAILHATSSPQQIEPLQHQIDIMLSQIAVTTAQIQQLTAENREIRQAITRLELTP